MNIDIIYQQRDSMGYSYLPEGQLRILKSRGLGTVLFGNNFITPILIGYVLIPNGFCELTKSRDDLWRYADTDKWLPCVGVTVVLNNEKRNDLSESFFKLEDAIDYIKKLICHTKESSQEISSTSPSC